MTKYITSVASFLIAHCGSMLIGRPANWTKRALGKKTIIHTHTYIYIYAKRYLSRP